MRIVAVLALAVGLALLAPARAWAPTTAEYIIIVGLATEDAATLVLSIKEGELRSSGSVRLGYDVLLPQASGSSARFADANGNGDAGLTQAEIALAHLRTGRPATAVLRLAAGEDVDASGVYAGTLEICVGSDCTHADTEIRAVVNAFRSGGTR